MTPRRALDLRLWQRILAHTRPHRRQLLGLAAMGLVVAGVDVALPLVTGRLVDHATTAGPSRVLAAYSAAYAGLVCTLAAAVFCFIMLAGQVATGVAYDLRTKGFQKLQAQSFAFFDVRPVGWLVTRLTSDVSKIANLIPWFTLDLCWGALTVLGVSATMLWLHSGLAIFVLAIVPPLAALSLFFKGRLLGSAREIRRKSSQITASFNQALAGARTTKALVREAQNLDEFRELTGGMSAHSMRNAVQQAIYLPLVTGLGSVGVGLALWKGGVVLGHGLTLGTLIAFMQYAVLFYVPIEERAAHFTDLLAAQAAAERVQGLLDEVPAIRDSDAALAAMAAAPLRGASDGGDERIETIELRGLEFAYKPDEPVLRGIDLTVRAGETVALVGATGGGKSTIVSLIARYYEPTGGVILVNGTDYRERGEGGGRLSTGQRQLLSLARAVIADPQVFVMDEATSSVDTETERLVQAAIDRVLRDRTAFVVAHRLSTIRGADRILVIDGGRIAEQGTHHALLKQRGRYFRLCSRQLTAGALVGAAGGTG